MNLFVKLFFFLIIGEVNLTIKGYNFGTELTQSMDVYVGGKPCQIHHWNLTDIRCLLPRLPPGKHNIHVEVRNWGFASTRCGNEHKIDGIVEYMGLIVLASEKK